MSPERWKQVKTLVDACLERPVRERNRYLASVCADAEVCGEVVSLLAAHSESDDFLENAPGLSVGIAEAIGTHNLIGERIGPYIVEQEIGHGGMGVVYRAVRADDEFRLDVAIKVVHAGNNSAGVLRRFRTERRILAGLDHPYIARLIDGGTIPSGSPYFVMEYVDGVPLHRFCDENRLGIVQRLELFRKICEAVSYAHRHLIVHRDLKPSNILVTADGTPKLLDFGIAKLIRESETGADHTATIRMATPAYASPEQIRGTLVGTTGDVYSLGVILYELLTGRSPYAIHRGDPGELAAMICEREPTRPSGVVTSLENYDISTATERAIDAPELADRRSTTPDSLRKKLRGELDNIVAKALRKEPERRYPSVDQLSEDVQRYLSGQPVIARKDTFAYRTRKFVQRHPFGIAFGSTAIVLLCITTAFAVWKAQQLSVRVAEDHKLATSFLTDIHDAIANLPGSTPAREALLEQSLRYMNGLARDTGSEEELERALALAYEKFADLQGGTSGGGLGRPNAAFETVLRAQAIRERFVADHPNDRQMQVELTKNYLLASFLAGRTRTQAERLQYDRKALDLAMRLVAAAPNDPGYRSLLAKAHVSIAYGYTFSAQFAEARQHFAEALNIRNDLARNQPENFAAKSELAQIYYRIGTSYVDTRQPAEAIIHLRRAFEIQSSLAQQEPDNERIRSDLASTYHFLGMAHEALNQTSIALVQFNHAISIREATVESDPKNARARALLAGNYAEKARALLEAGSHSAALDSISAAIDLQEGVLRLDPNTVPGRISMAEYLARAGTIQAHIAEEPRRKPAQRLANWSAAASAFRRSNDLYESLREQGHLRSPLIAADAARVKGEIERVDREARRLQN